MLLGSIAASNSTPHQARSWLWRDSSNNLVMVAPRLEVDCLLTPWCRRVLPDSPVWVFSEPFSEVVSFVEVFLELSSVLVFAGSFLSVVVVFSWAIAHATNFRSFR